MKVAICVPCGDMIHTEFTMSLLGMQLAIYSHPIHPEQDVNVYFHRSSILIKSRQDLVKQALDGGADWILWLDSDMAFPPDTLHRLLGRNKDVVGCNYVTRTIPTKPVAVRADRMHIRTDPDSAGLEEAEWTGFGCLLVNADIYRNLEMPWFDFVWLENSDDIMGEDVFFFKKVKHFLGKQLYIDHDLSQMVRHIGQFEYHNRLALATIEDYKARGESLEGIENAK